MEVEENLNIGLIVKDPLAWIAQTIGVPTSPKPERVRYGPTSIENFRFLFLGLIE